MSVLASPRSLVSKLKCIFPGWWIVLSGGFQFGWGQGVSQLGVFMKPLQTEFGWSRAQISVAASLAPLEGGFQSLPLGLAVDKWGPRVMQLIGLTILGLGLIGMYFVNSLWMLYVVWFIAVSGHNLGYVQVLDKAVADWFARRRGLALSITRAINSGLVPPVLMLISWLLYSYGWREAFLVAGIGTMVTGLPLTWFVIRSRRPEYYGWLPDGKKVDESVAGDTEAAIAQGAAYAAEAGEVEFTVRQAMRNRILWLYLLFFMIRNLATPVVGVHLIPYLTDIGLDPVMAAGIMGAQIAFQIPSRLLFGWLTDVVRVTRMKYLLVIVVLVEIVGVFILMQVKSMGMVGVWAFVVVYGFGGGATVAILPPMRARFWGRKSFATITGMMMTAMAIGGVVAPIYAGWSYDTTGSYLTAFKILIGTLVVAVVAALFLNPPKPPEKIGKVTDFI